MEEFDGHIKPSLKDVIEASIKSINIALIAHDGKKADMVAFVMEHKALLNKKHINLYATGTTGGKVKNAGLEVNLMKSGPMGGDAEIAAMVSNQIINAVIFFRDPLGKHPHEPDVQMLMRLCDVHEVPLATNKATADYLIKCMLNT